MTTARAGGRRRLADLGTERAVQAMGVRREQEGRSMVFPISLSMAALGVVVGVPGIGAIVGMLYGVGHELGSAVGRPPGRWASYGLAGLHALFLVALGA